MEGRKILFPSTGGNLEGLFHRNEALPVKGGVILCHPHPLYGGNMRNPVVSAGAEAALEAGFSAFRFNFRGVGGSEGSYTDGPGEGEDVRAALEYLTSTFKSQDPILILLGYSFGAWTGLPVAVRDDRIRSMVAIAPPLDRYDFSFLEGCRKRKLIIAGSRDLYCPPHLLDPWYKKLEEPKSIAVVPGADHFLFSHQAALCEVLREFFEALG